MRYQPLGNSGLHVSVVGLGCNNFGSRLDLEGTRAVLDAAIDVGITLLDTADIYGGSGNAGASETLMGKALQGRRDQIVLATKWGHQQADMGYGPAAGAKGGRAYIRQAVEASLNRLQTDHIDLYQLHTPDPVTPLEETIQALAELVTAGKIRYIGHSNFPGHLIAQADAIAHSAGLPPFISAQNHYSLLERGVETEVIPACVEFGVGMLPYFPLANGLLTGKATRENRAPEGSRLSEANKDGYVTDSKLDVVEALTAWGREHSRSMLEIAIGALGAQPAVASVIAGATKPEQVIANAAAGDWIPTADELAEIDAIAPTRRTS